MGFRWRIIKYGFFLQIEVTSDNAPYGAKADTNPPPAVSVTPDSKQFSVKRSKLHWYNICVCAYDM